ncbi:MAG: hypothetical protein AB7D36_11180, partial [Oscillospiraceae bacterium]
MFKISRTANSPRRGTALSALATILVGLFFGGVSIVYASLGIKQPLALFLSYLHKPAILALNLLPVLLLCDFLWLITNRVWLSALITGLAVMGLSCVNYLKLLFRGDPLIAK